MVWEQRSQYFLALKLHIRGLNYVHMSSYFMHIKRRTVLTHYLLLKNHLIPVKFEKIPHTGDKASLDRCGQQHLYHSRVTEKNHPKRKNSKNVQKYDNISDTPFDQRSLIHGEAWFPPCFVGPRIPQNPIFLKNKKNQPKRKNSKTSRNMPKFAIRPLTRDL